MKNLELLNLQFLSLVAVLCLTSTTRAQEAPRPPLDVVTADYPNDAGTAAVVRWTLSPDDVPDRVPAAVTGYEVFRRTADEAEFVRVGEAARGEREFIDRQEIARGQQYDYRVRTVGPDGTSEFAEAASPVTPTLPWFHQGRFWLAVMLVIVCGSVVGFIAWAKSGRALYVRPIPGLQAVDEAVGRATEMGRTCLFITGVQDINDIQTVAGITVMSRVARLTAEYGARLEIPTSRSLVMTTARETMQAAYVAAGRPDAYREDDIYYLTDEQFGFVAGVTGTMRREKPAACFYFGAFFAESLIFAETGNAIGAIQVAGTAEEAQLPFFVTACDYTLIGEEFFAASAYLSGEPVQLGSLRGQDVGKLVVAALVIVGCAASTWGAVSGSPAAITVVDFLKDNVLGSGGIWP
jgi:hypothetical protein